MSRLYVPGGAAEIAAKFDVELRRVNDQDLSAAAKAWGDAFAKANGSLVDQRNIIGGKVRAVRELRNRLYADGLVDVVEQIDRALGDNPVTPEMASAQRSIAEELMAAKSRISELEAANILPAVMRLVAERKRQIAAEGWTPAHDDEHVFGELATAAACYAWRAVWQTAAENDEPPNNWPWDDAWWKPDTQERMLEKAGAMIVAELERLERAKT